MRISDWSSDVCSSDLFINENSSIQIKNSVSYFNRNTTIPSYQFEGTQTATFTEANYTNSTEKAEWVAGINIWTDNFKEEQITAFPLRDYNQTTLGAFVKNSGKRSEESRVGKECVSRCRSRWWQ